MKRIIFAVALAASTWGAPSCRAWDAGGHMISARIAFDRLSPELKGRVQALTAQAPDFREKRGGVAPRPYDFVSLSTWMDDVRSSGRREALSTWHYINVECGQAPHEVEEQNALDALGLAAIVLKSDAPDKAKGEWLAIAIHVIGDLHQPLHASGRDRGGNDFWIRGAPGIEARVTRAGKSVDRKKPLIGTNTPYFQRLHALWDSGYRVDVAKGSKSGARREKVALYDIGNSDGPDMTRVASVSAQIVGKYVPERADISADASTWVSESSQISCGWAFSLGRGSVVGVDYIERLHDVSCTRLALAGLRMARWIEENVK